MTQQKLAQDLEWVEKVDPNKVYDALVKFAMVSKDESGKEYFVSRWSTNWYQCRFGGNLGYGGKLIREVVRFWGEGHVPNFRVSCYREDNTEKREQIVNDISKELLKILVEAGLRPNVQKK